MIREASYDSLLSELGAALSVNEDVGASTEGMFDRLEGDVSDLRCVTKINLLLGFPFENPQVHLLQTANFELQN